jgi:hypothetical protein
MKYFARLAALVLTGAAIMLPLAAAAAGLDQLDRFAGTWTSPGVLVDTPYSKAASVTATTTCAWSSEHLFMICRQSVSNGAKIDHDLAIYTFDAAANAFHFFNVRSSQVSSVPIEVRGDTITYTDSFADGSKRVTIRTLNVWETPNLYRWRTEYSNDAGATWTLMGSGTSQRQ